MMLQHHKLVILLFFRAQSFAQRVVVGRVSVCNAIENPICYVRVLSVSRDMISCHH